MIRHPISAWGAVKAASELSGAWARSLIDALPPYRAADGTLEGKETGEGGEFIIIVNGARISVDAATFRLLKPGERLRVSYTARLRRAVSIVRYVERNGRGNAV